MTTTVKIKKGWVIKKEKTKDSETIVATKKFFTPHKNGYSAGSIEYSSSYGNIESDKSVHKKLKGKQNKLKPLIVYNIDSKDDLIKDIEEDVDEDIDEDFDEDIKDK